jgi:hypothetical protein
MRRAGRKRGARFESSEALAEQLAVARSAVELCMDAAPGCRFQRRSSINVLTAWPGRVAQAPRARVDRALLGPAHHIGTRVEKRTVGGSARARRRSELTNRRRRCHTGSRLPAGTSVGDLPTSSVSTGPADPPISVFCANTPRIAVLIPYSYRIELDGEMQLCRAACGRGTVLVHLSRYMVQVVTD